MIETWLKKHSKMYVGATRHPFILSIRDGEVDRSAFRRWLAQDYLFVRAFVPFVASVLLKASNESDSISDVDVILGGLAALSDEIGWFKKEASKWNVDLENIVPQKANQEYCRYLETLMDPEVEYAVALATFWAIEAIYQESFAHCLEQDSKTSAELKETCKRWGNEGFKQYCLSLKEIAKRRLDNATDDVKSKAEVSFLQILELEVSFWNMSSGGES